MGVWTHCEAWRELLDVIKRHVNPHYAKNQLILVLMGSMREKMREGGNNKRKNSRRPTPHLMCSRMDLLHLFVPPFIFGLGFIEDW